MNIKKYGILSIITSKSSVKQQLNPLNRLTMTTLDRQIPYKNKLCISKLQQLS